MIINYLEKIQLESGEDVQVSFHPIFHWLLLIIVSVLLCVPIISQRAIENMDNMVTGMIGINEEFKVNFRDCSYNYLSSAIYHPSY